MAPADCNPLADLLIGCRLAENIFFTDQCSGGVRATLQHNKTTLYYSILSHKKTSMVSPVIKRHKQLVIAEQPDILAGFLFRTSLMCLQPCQWDKRAPKRAGFRALLVAATRRSIAGPIVVHGWILKGFVKFRSPFEKAQSRRRRPIVGGRARKRLHCSGREPYFSGNSAALFLKGEDWADSRKNGLCRLPLMLMMPSTF